MSLFATSNATTQSKVHHSEYLITDSDPNGLRMTSSRISKLATQQRIAAMRARVSHKHQLRIRGIKRFYHA